MTILKAVILGLIQGISEFLPISSSGHLALAGKLMGMNPEAESMLSFNIMLHAATLLAVFLVFYKDIFGMIGGFFGGIADICTGKGLRLKEYPYRRLILLLIVGTLPATIVAFSPLNHYIENPPLAFVGIGLMITAAIMFISDKLKGGSTDTDTMNYKQALVVGAFQAAGVFPGISRSGTTIVGGLFAKLDRATAVRFSFLLSIPATLGAVLLDILDFSKSAAGDISALHIVFGMLAAFVSGYLSIKFLLALVQKCKLKYFGFYCIFAGVLAIVLNFVK